MAHSRTGLMQYAIRSIWRLWPVKSLTWFVIALIALPATLYSGIFVTLAILAAVLGVSRAVQRQPFRPEYQRWLALTPWTLVKPLPFATLSLVWQDSVWLLLPMGIVAYFRPALVMSWPVGFLAGFLFMRSILYRQARSGMYGLVMLTLWLVTFSLLPLEGDVLLKGSNVLTAMMAIMLLLDHWMTSQGVPEIVNAQLLPQRIGPNPQSPIQDASQLSEISGRTEFRNTTLARAFFHSLFVGWITFLLASYILTIFENGKFIVLIIFLVFVLGKPVNRLILFLKGTMPPISLVGRLKTRRFIIPGYDLVFVAPVIAFVLGIILTVAVFRSGMNPLIIAASMAVLDLAILLPGPSLSRFRLTGCFHFRELPVRAVTNERTTGAPVRPNAASDKYLLNLARLLYPRGSFFAHWTLAWTIPLLFINGCFGSALLLLHYLHLSEAIAESTSLDFSIGIFVAFILIQPVALFAWTNSRISTFHPLWPGPTKYPHGHLNWLKALGWRPAMRLPLGPVHFTWWDVLPVASFAAVPVVLGILARSTTRWDFALHYAYGGLVVFAAVFIFKASVMLFEMGRSHELIAIGFLVGACFYAVQRWEYVAVLLLLTIGVGAWGISKGWASFPWDKTWPASLPDYATGIGRREAVSNAEPVLHKLAGRSAPLLPRISTRILCILLTTWWTWLAAKFFIDDNLRVLWVPLGVAFLYRVKAYEMFGAIRRFTPMARVRHMRLIIPGNDVVFIAPLAAAGTWYGRVWMTRHFEWATQTACPVIVVVVLTILVFAPPSLRRWRLMGN